MNDAGKQLSEGRYNVLDYADISQLSKRAAHHDIVRVLFHPNQIDF